MNFFELVKKRKTTYEFSSDSIPDKEVNLILEAGQWAPSCTNSQPWNFIVIKNPKTIDKLIGTANYGDFHTDPPLIIAVVLREVKCAGEGHSCFRGNDSGVYDSYMSCGMAALQMTLQAADVNINSCLLTPEQKGVKEILKVPKKDAVPLLICFGYEKKGAFQKKREREELKKICLYESFKEK